MLVELAYRIETGLRERLARRARERGWTSAVVADPGYGSSGRVRVLGRATLAPAGLDPGSRRGLPGWRRLLTLEEPRAEVVVEVSGARHVVRCDDGGLLDATVDADLPAGRATATLRAADRDAVTAPIHVADPRATTGVVCDIDDTVWLTGLRHPVRAAWRTLGPTQSRRPIGGMAELLRHVVRDHAHNPVVYLSNGPWNLAGPITRFLAGHGFPPGPLLMTDWGITPTRWFRDGKAHKRAALERLASDMPGVRWVLVGDDGEHDPVLYADFVRRHPERVAAIVLREVVPGDDVVLEAPSEPETVGDVPVVRGRDGEALLRRVRERLDGEELGHDWFLTVSERGNDATRIRAWTEGNAVRPLVHGRSYFPALADALAGAGDGDAVFFVDWRGDPDEQLTDDGPTVRDAFCDAAGRGVMVKGLLWRSHLDKLRFSGDQNRDLSVEIGADDDGEVLLDQRVRPLGSHHQKFVVVRHLDRPQDDVAFVGGIDLAHSRRDDADHGGDPQTQPFASGYGGSPAWHDVQVEIRGPAVRDVEDGFRERWEDPAVLSRLPWQVIPDVVRGLDRTETPLPDPLPDPPRAGTCAVQLLRTYPNRWPGYPFAPDGERSAARGYAKALRRARRLVYVEDQYLWSTDVACVFAEALRRAPDLHLVAVVPRFPDQDGRVSRPPVHMGHAQALEMVRAAGGDRVQVLDIENREGEPVYVHAKVCVVDDVWATVGSDNFNRRSWTHDSELTAAVVDDERDPREPGDPAGLGDGARRFARELRLELMREHLDRADGEDDDLVDLGSAVAALRRSAQELDRWYDDGRRGERPPGRLRTHSVEMPPRWQRWLSQPVYRGLIDPDGRPPRMKLRGTH